MPKPPFMPINLAFLPNIITLARIALVPVLILLLKDQDYAAALWVFAVAGVSDGLDGFLAKRYRLESRLGAVLDPAADKILMVSTYVMLTVLEHIPFWLMLTVVFRDLVIVGGYLAYTTHHGPVRMRPSMLSKINTVAQIVFAVLILVRQAWLSGIPIAVTEALTWAVFATTVASGIHYLWSWGIMHDIEPAKARRRRHDRGA